MSPAEPENEVMTCESEDEESIEQDHSQKQAKPKKISKVNTKENTSCLACNKKCTGSQASVFCQLCSLWCHKSCAGMSDAVFKSLALQMKEMGMAYWACRSCLNFATKTNALLKNMDKQMQTMNAKIEKNTEKIEATQKELKKVDNGLKNVERRVEEVKKSVGDELYEEMRERETRRLNLVLHGVQEQEETRSYRERSEMDKEECCRIFGAMKIQVNKENIKFCKRLGEIGEEPRPTVIGLNSEEMRRKILEGSRDLQNTKYSRVSVVADLTRRQREEERKMMQEAERRNKNLSEEEKSKNLKWLVVGRKGEKRLILGEERTTSYRNSRETDRRRRETREYNRAPREDLHREYRPRGENSYRREENSHRRSDRSKEQEETIRHLEDQLRKAKRASTHQGEMGMEERRGPGKRARTPGTDTEELTEPNHKATKQ